MIKGGRWEDHHVEWFEYDVRNGIQDGVIKPPVTIPLQIFVLIISFFFRLLFQPQNVQTVSD